jgi:hypothetical protein
MRAGGRAFLKVILTLSRTSLYGGEVEVNPAKRNAEKEMLRASESIEKKGFIINGISKYIQYWRSGMARNARYAAEMSCFVEYCERIHQEITGPLPFQPDNLQEGFWPMSDWRRDHARRCSIENGPTYSADNSPEDDPEPYPFCGPPRTDRGRTSTPTAMFYSGILSSAAPVIITTSPCGWVVL